jgi:hypothetical protein
MSKNKHFSSDHSIQHREGKIQGAYKIIKNPLSMPDSIKAKLFHRTSFDGFGNALQEKASNKQRD